MLQSIFLLSDSGGNARETAFWAPRRSIHLCLVLGAGHFKRVADVLNGYLGGLNEDLIKDNFVIVYELLDEMIDNGFPLITEPNILPEMIAPPNIVGKVLSFVTGSSSNVSDTLTGATASCVPWRTADPKYANNEVNVDLVEEMYAIISRSLWSNVSILVFQFLTLIILLVRLIRNSGLID